MWDVYVDVGVYVCSHCVSTVQWYCVPPDPSDGQYTACTLVPASHWVMVLLTQEGVHTQATDTTYLVVMIWYCGDIGDFYIVSVPSPSIVNFRKLVVICYRKPWLSYSQYCSQYVLVISLFAVNGWNFRVPRTFREKNPDPFWLNSRSLLPCFLENNTRP